MCRPSTGLSVNSSVEVCLNLYRDGLVSMLVPTAPPLGAVMPSLSGGWADGGHAGCGSDDPWCGAALAQVADQDA